MTSRLLHHRSANARRLRRFTAPLIGVALSATLIGPIAASGQTSGTEAQKRDEVRRKKADVAAGLDGLTATDEELEVSVRTLAENLKAQQARAHDAGRAVDEARRHLDVLSATVAETQAQVDALSVRVQRRAVEAYVHPNGKLDTAEDALRTDDFTGAERKAELLNAATGHDADVQDEFRAAKALLESQRNAAAGAEVEAQRREAEAGAQVQQVQVAKNEKDRMKAALDIRISNLQAEVGALAAEDVRLTQLILAAQAAVEVPVLAAADVAGGVASPSDPSGSATTLALGAPTTGGAAPSGSPTTRPVAPVITAAPTAPPGNVGRLSWPASGSVTSGYGPRWGAMHSGIDIAAPAGTPTVAAAAGTVISAGFNGGGYGNLVLVDHGGGMVTAYAHHSSISVSVGQQVSRGQQLGGIGCTGSCTGDHLHFEVRVNGRAQNPMNYL